VLVSGGEKSYTMQRSEARKREVIRRYPRRSLNRPTEKNEPTSKNLKMILGEEPPYRPMLSEQIDVEQGLQELECGTKWCKS